MKNRTSTEIPTYTMDPDIVAPFIGGKEVLERVGGLFVVRNTVSHVFTGGGSFSQALQRGVECSCCGLTGSKDTGNEAYISRQRPKFVLHLAYATAEQVEDPEALEHLMGSTDLPASRFVAQIPKQGQPVSHRDCYDSLPPDLRPGVAAEIDRKLTPVQNWVNAASIILLRSDIEI